jgi:cystathionine beta-lyase/cystathionine gamma-synthase
MTHADVAPEVKERLGVTPGLVRFSVGVEHYEDIVADVSQALHTV